MVSSQPFQTDHDSTPGKTDIDERTRSWGGASTPVATRCVFIYFVESIIRTYTPPTHLMSARGRIFLQLPTQAPPSCNTRGTTHHPFAPTNARRTHRARDGRPYHTHPPFRSHKRETDASDASSPTHHHPPPIHSHERETDTSDASSPTHHHPPPIRSHKRETDASDASSPPPPTTYPIAQTRDTSSPTHHQPPPIRLPKRETGVI